MDRIRADAVRFRLARQLRLASKWVLLGAVVLPGAAVGVAALAGASGGSGSGPPAPTESPPLAGQTVASQTESVSSIPHRLEVVTQPPGAGVMVTTAGGTRQSGQTPFTRMLESGPLEVSVSLEGYNPISQQLVLDGDRVLKLWLDPTGLLHHKLGEFVTGSKPKQVAFSPDGHELWVTLLGGQGVEVFDASTFQRLGEIDLGAHGAVEVIFSADGTTAYVSQMETASVFEVDRNTFGVRRRLATGGAWSKAMALAPSRTTLYVSNWSSDNVSEIDLISGGVRRLIKTVSTPRGLYVTPDGRWLVVAGFGEGKIARIDLSDGGSRMLLATGGAVRHLVGDPERNLVYADDTANDETFVINLETQKARKLADTNATPNTIDLSPDGRVLYVSNRGANGKSYYLPGPEWGSVLAIDTSSGAVLDAIVGGNQTTGLDISPDGGFLAFSDFLDNRVQVFEVPPYQTLAAGGGGRAKAHVADLRK